MSRVGLMQKVGAREELLGKISAPLEKRPRAQTRLEGKVLTMNDRNAQKSQLIRTELRCATLGCCCCSGSDWRE